jgi:hypothetical protein
MVDTAEARRQQREMEARDATTYAPTSNLFVAALEHDHRLTLPPPCAVPDPLSREFGRSATAAKSVSLGKATLRALNDLHEEVEEDMRGGAAKDDNEDEESRRKARADLERAAAEQAEREAAHKKRLEDMRTVRDRNRLMDLNDDEMSAL